MYGSTQFLKLIKLVSYVYPYFVDADRKEVFLQILDRENGVTGQILHVISTSTQDMVKKTTSRANINI